MTRVPSTRPPLSVPALLVRPVKPMTLVSPICASRNDKLRGFTRNEDERIRSLFSSRLDRRLLAKALDRGPLQRSKLETGRCGSARVFFLSRKEKRKKKEREEKGGEKGKEAFQVIHNNNNNNNTHTCRRERARARARARARYPNAVRRPHSDSSHSDYICAPLFISNESRGLVRC